MIIALGYHCNVSFLNQSLRIKKETGAFEWLECRKLQYITDVINTLTDNPESNVIFGRDKRVHLLNPYFYSGHYNLNEYKTIFKRRYDRFIDNIKTTENLYFVRINPIFCKTTKNEIELFIKSIKKINPNIKFNFLLIETIINETEINSISIDSDNVKFYHNYFYQRDVSDVYMKSPTIIDDIYKKMLEDIGYNTNETNDIIFNDKCDI
jgi:hypothetical protein